MDVLFAAETSKAMGFPFLLIVNLAGWSKAAGQFILARCGVDGVKQTRPAIEVMTSQFSSDPPLPNRRMAEFLTPEGAFQFAGDATVRRWFEAQRDTNYAIPGGASGCLVGGQLQHTWLTAEGFAGTRFLHEWPDEIGRPVEREPVDGPRDEYVDVAWGEWSPPTGEPAHFP